ncbi:MAG TPA: hypothetical protein VMF33_02060 [Acidimicrobiales bacterium]|nr:hypothetical protein [Acidimicrobiales bacterium]
MTSLRSEDWAVQPPFVPNGPTSPVTLLFDEAGLTQLAGIPAIAWQTPWSEVANVELVRVGHRMLLFASVAGVRYVWRHRDLEGYDALRVIVAEHGGIVTERRPRLGVYVVVAIVILASLGGGIAAWFNRGSAARSELADARHVNLRLDDLPSGWYKTSDTVLNYLVSPPSKVYTSTTTTALPKNSIGDEAARVFQKCLGVSNATDRVYGAAGQEPDYQVASPIFNTDSLDGIELASTAQYYHSLSMVDKDTHEMSMSNFGSCFVTSSADIILAGLGSKNPASVVARNWQPTTFAKGWTRGGVVRLDLPNVKTKVQLVMVVITHGHYEVTLSAIVGSFAKSETLLNGLVNTLLSRTENASSTSA